MAQGVTFRLEAQTADAVRGYMEVVNAQKRADRAFRDTTQSAKGLDSTLSKIGNYAAGFASIGAVTATIARGFTAAHAQAVKAAEGIEQSVEALQKLVQISANLKDLRTGQELAKQISLTTGLPERQALELVGKGKAGGASDAEIRTTARLATFESRPMEIADQMRDLMGALGDGVERFDVALNVVGTAAQKSEQTLGQFSGMLLDSVRLGTALGGPREQVLGEVSAAASVMAANSASATEGVSRLELVLSKLQADDRGRFRGMGTMESLAKFADMPEQVRKSIVGERRESLIAMQTVVPLVPQMRAMAQEIETARAKTGTPGGYLERKEFAASLDPRLAGTRARMRGAAALEQSQMQFGGKEEIRAGLIDAFQADDVKRGVGAWGQAIKRFAWEGAAGLGMSPETMVALRSSTSARAPFGGLGESEVAGEAAKFAEFIVASTLLQKTGEKLDIAADKLIGVSDWLRDPSGGRYMQNVREYRAEHGMAPLVGAHTE